ncbi:hypothetical protein Tco_1435333 [Tanacetum coccineum]
MHSQTHPCGVEKRTKRTLGAKPRSKRTLGAVLITKRILGAKPRSKRTLYAVLITKHTLGAKPRSKRTLGAVLMMAAAGESRDGGGRCSGGGRRMLAGEPSESITTTTIPSKDKGKGIMVEEPLKMKKKDQISFDEHEAIRLQAEFDEEVTLAREKDESNVALIEEWNDI